MKNIVSNLIHVRQVTFLLLSVFSLLVIGSCKKVDGEGPLVTQLRDVSNFKSVSVSISGKVNYTIAPQYRVEIEAQQNILDVLQTNKVGDELVIKVQDGIKIKDYDPITVTISAPYAESVNLSGSGMFNLVNDLTANNLNLRVSGSGNITIHKAVLTDRLTSTISGSGNITVLDGAVKNETLTISGSGGTDLSFLSTENTNATISGSGDIRVNVSQALDATISGSGSVWYHGNPLVSTHISGSGKVKPF
jgi:hypothetical protein